MAVFRYTALAADGQMQRGQAWARDSESLAHSLHQQQLLPVRIDALPWWSRAWHHWRGTDGAPNAGAAENTSTPHAHAAVDSKRAPTSAATAFWRRRSLPAAARIDFCFHVHELLAAGVPLSDALCDLRDTLPPTTALHAAVVRLAEAIHSGMSLSAAMRLQPANFDERWVHLVAAGEHSGSLAAVLKRMADSLTWQEQMRRARSRLWLYPAVAGTVVLAAALFLLIYLVPQLQQLTAGMGYQAPWYSRVLFALSAFLLRHWQTLALAAAAFVAALALLPLMAHFFPHLAARCRWWRDRVLLGTPWLGDLSLKWLLANYAELMALLYAAGVPVLTALDLCQPVLGNRALMAAAGQARRNIGSGQTVAAAFRATEPKLFPPFVLRMLAVGEQTGRLDNALQHVYQFYERDVRDGVARLHVLIEPLLTLLLGALLAWIMLAVLTPVYDLIAQVQP